MSMDAAKAAGLGPATLWVLSERRLERDLFMSPAGWSWSEGDDGMTAEEIEEMAIDVIRLVREEYQSDLAYMQKRLADFEASCPDVVT